MRAATDADVMLEASIEVTKLRVRNRGSTIHIFVNIQATGHAFAFIHYFFRASPEGRIGVTTTAIKYPDVGFGRFPRLFVEAACFWEPEVDARQGI